MISDLDFNFLDILEDGDSISPSKFLNKVDNGSCWTTLPKHNFISSQLVNSSVPIYKKEMPLINEKDLCLDFNKKVFSTSCQVEDFLNCHGKEFATPNNFDDSRNLQEMGVGFSLPGMDYNSPNSQVKEPVLSDVVIQKLDTFKENFFTTNINKCSDSNEIIALLSNGIAKGSDSDEKFLDSSNTLTNAVDIQMELSLLNNNRGSDSPKKETILSNNFNKSSCLSFDKEIPKSIENKLSQQKWHDSASDSFNAPKSITELSGPSDVCKHLTYKITSCKETHSNESNSFKDTNSFKSPKSYNNNSDATTSNSPIKFLPKVFIRTAKICRTASSKTKTNVKNSTTSKRKFEGSDSEEIEPNKKYRFSTQNSPYMRQTTARPHDDLSYLKEGMAKPEFLCEPSEGCKKNGIINNLNPNKLYQGLLNDILEADSDVTASVSIRSKLTRIKRKDLEDMMIEQLVNKLLYDHELGYQRDLCKRLETTLEAANAKALRLTKEVESLKNVTTKLSTEYKKRKTQCFLPSKVKRSVGIQANQTYISQGYSTAFLPCSDVRLMTPTKFKKYRRKNGKKSTDSLSFSSKNDLPKCDEKYSYDNEGVCSKLKKNPLNKSSSFPEDEKPLNGYKDSSDELEGKWSKKHTVNGKRKFLEDKKKSDNLVPVKRHPAHLPNSPHWNTDKRDLPPQPTLRIHLRNKSIILSWNADTSELKTAITSFQIYSYEEGKEDPSPSLWKRIGSVKYLQLPMACTLNEFRRGRIYHFAVRAVDKNRMIGQFSQPKSLRMPFK